MTTRRALFVAAIVALASVGACRRKDAWPPSPASVALGEDACTECRMIVGDDRFGAQVQDRSGNLAIFDDLGCMRVHARSNAFELAGVFVRSFRTRGWVPGAAAWVVESRAFPSPMGYGVAAFEDERSAREEAARHPDSNVRPLTEYLSSSSLLSGGK